MGWAKKLYLWLIPRSVFVGLLFSGAYLMGYFFLAKEPPRIIGEEHREIGVLSCGSPQGKSRERIYQFRGQAYFDRYWAAFGAYARCDPWKVGGQFEVLWVWIGDGEGRVRYIVQAKNIKTGEFVERKNFQLWQLKRAADNHFYIFLIARIFAVYAIFVMGFCLIFGVTKREIL
ncbi:hypothetical protein N8I74_07430 [Chitiniphilus purpureus]|uniref:DUF3592 domain-containing protein n=1 Tax=Chitiniphilus purpureus TaxID=2981137 RepID=A0ABY6DSY6_9NEIS|nr:hypothetical protein [Chitiniphilus sp. CD1]UXY16838.1 hypothetical protein N8I74_07430 [Chitiniphilus sp. CD1]